MADLVNTKLTLAPFQSQGVTLRPIGESDLQSTLEWRNREDARRWFKTSAPLAWADHHAWFQKYGTRVDDYLFIVEAQGQAVGQASVYHINHSTQSAEVGRFLVSPEYSGRGYIDQACAALITLCREQFNLNYLFLEVFEENQRAIRLYKHHGFVQELSQGGLLRMGLRLD